MARYFATFMILNILFEIVSPSLALALTNPKVQPEHSGFDSAASSEMVDLFTGDFKYNIPLLDVEGYPVNLSYRAGQTMEAEASWVGLGWNLNPGCVNRFMKGLPDDFNGDVVNSETNLRDNYKTGVGMQLKTFGTVGAGILNIGAALGFNGSFGALLGYNNYTGHSLEMQFDVGGSFGGGASAVYFTGIGVGVAGGTGWKINSAEGVTKTSYASESTTLFNGLDPDDPNPLNVTSTNIGEGTIINSRTGSEMKMYFGSHSNQSIFNGAVPFGDDRSRSSSGAIPVGNLSYAPRINNSFLGMGSSSDKKFGVYACAGFSILDYFSVTAEYGILLGPNRYSTTTKMVDRTKSLKAYGYLNLENSDNKSLMDFNRFKDGTFMSEQPNGSYSTIQNDVFYACGQGMTGAFRAHRSDIGHVHDPEVSTHSSNNFKGRELGLTALLYRYKTDMTSVGTTSQGDWSSSPMSNLSFYKPDPTDPSDRFYEKTYFKFLGEPLKVDQTFNSGIGNENPLQPSLSLISNQWQASSPISPNHKRQARDWRANHIQTLNAKDAKDIGFQKQVKYYTLNAASIDPVTRQNNQFSVENRTSLFGSAKDHHLSEMCITKTDGSRYYYGVPVYNNTNKSVTFNTSDFSFSSIMANPLTNTKLRSVDQYQTDYSAQDASLNNVNGRENYYSSKEIPSYAQSFLLSSIVSNDYVDITGDGPTNDDLGNYTLFNYTHDGLYKWRIPTIIPAGHPNKGTLPGTSNEAVHDLGLRSDPYDNKAYFEYGERENWYLNSIETKNFIAVFKVSPRDDNFGVTDQDGALLTSKDTYKLDKIILYTKEELIRNPLNPEPLKSVNFKYDYSLCPKTYNNKNTSANYGGVSADASGKLTLKKIYFTYGNSDKSALSPYVFGYGDNDHTGGIEANPEYDPRAIDRWGNYKENSSSAQMDNVEFPYTEQDQAKADVNAASWNLTSITTPTGAKVDVYFEADDYSYVQDEAAGTALYMKGVFNTINSNPSFDYSSVAPTNDLFNDAYILIDLKNLNKGVPTILSKAQADVLVSQKMFPKNKKLFMKCMVKLLKQTTYPDILGQDYDEAVPLYGQVVESGIINKTGSNGNTYGSGQYYEYAWIKIKTVNAYDDKYVSPIAQAGWEFTRIFMPRVAYPGSEPNSSLLTAPVLPAFIQLIQSCGTAWVDHKNAMNNDPNKRFYKRNYSKSLDPSRSYVRAYNPYKTKIGGGHRVKKILTNDNWSNSVASEKNSTYGVEYSYTTKENNTTISSGVASYEPFGGGDENTLHQPINFTVQRSVAPNDHYFEETPYMELLYPSPLVGYSLVSIKSIDYTIPVTSDPVCQVGKTEYEFYTAKEFPVIERKSGLNKVVDVNDPIDDYIQTPLLYSIASITQGFAVKLNDMHGKMKSVKHFSQDNPTLPISGTTYYYKSTNLNGSGAKQLIQNVNVVASDLSITNQTIGKNIDVTNDLKSSGNFNVSIGISKMRKWSMCNPLGRRSVDLQYGVSFLGFNSATTTKVVQQYGILERIERFDNKAKTKTENLLWDERSGEVVLTKTTNNFDEPVYSLNYPAQWVYNNKSSRFDRDGIIYKVSTNTYYNLTTGVLDATLINTGVTILKPGDEVCVYNTAGNLVTDKYWICANPANANQYFMLDKDGNKLTSSTTGITYSSGNELFIKIKRPIERNQLTASAGGVSTLVDPSGSTLTNPTTKIISSAAIQYCQIWDYYKNTNAGNVQQGATYPANYNPMSPSVVNPYVANQLGCYRPWRSFIYNTERDYSATQPNIKSDGVYKNYTPFWTYSGGVWNPNTASWQLVSENTVYSPYGYAMELRDARGLFNAQRYSFNHSFVALKASNSKVSEVGFDGFEDYYNYYNAFVQPYQLHLNNYLDFADQINVLTTNSAHPALTETQAHTGRFSLSFNSGQSVVLSHNLEGVDPEDLEPMPQPDIPRCDPQTITSLNKLSFTRKSHYISFWIKAKTNLNDYGTGVFTFNITSKNGANVPTANTYVITKSPVINGWQKFDIDVDIIRPLVGPNKVEFSFSVPGGSLGFYIDDFRVQPKNSVMNTMVYDPKSTRMWASMDERNFATIFEYDTEGNLVRTKKESVNGIYTLNETRKAIKK